MPLHLLMSYQARYSHSDLHNIFRNTSDNQLRSSTNCSQLAVLGIHYKHSCIGAQHSALSKARTYARIDITRSVNICMHHSLITNCLRKARDHLLMNLATRAMRGVARHVQRRLFIAVSYAN